MFFVRQQTNQCGLHAIQNMLKTAAITRDDMRTACQHIHEQTGDPIRNHETFGGDWSVSAVLQALHDRGFTVGRAVSSKQEREWSGASMDELLEDDSFRGFIVHQPLQRHFTCMRPETVDGEKYLYYVDSQSMGPIRISSRLAMRRCLAAAYAWEPYVVKGDEIEYVAPPENAISMYHATTGEKRADNSFKPSAEFLRDYHAIGRSEPILKTRGMPNTTGNDVVCAKEPEVLDNTDK